MVKASFQELNHFVFTIFPVTSLPLINRYDMENKKNVMCVHDVLAK